MPIVETLWSKLPGIVEALEPLIKKDHWLIWKLENEKKIPYQSLRPHKRASCNDPSTWSTYEEATAAGGGQVGFALPDSGIGALDLDDCRDAESGELDAWAQDLVERAEGAYIEVTPSGTGLRIIGRVWGPHVHTHRKMGRGKVEIYRNADRYITVTGRRIGHGRAGQNIDDLIDELRPSDNDKKKEKDSSNSGIFHKKVCERAERGWSIDQIERWIIRNANSAEWRCAQKYIEGNRLRQAIKLSYDKAKKVELLETEDELLRKFGVKSMDQVKSKNTVWLWYPFLARGEITIVEGDPDLGKSYLMQAVSRWICDGVRLPSVRHLVKMEGKVLYCDMENRISTVTKKRLEWMEMEHLDRFYQAEKRFNLNDADDFANFKALCEKIEPDVIVYDTGKHYLGKFNTDNSRETTEAMEALHQLSIEFDCAIVFIRHLTKSTKEKAIYRGQGNISFIGTARITMQVGYIPDDDEMRVAKCIKNNLTKKPQKGLTFTIAADPRLNDPDRSQFTFGEMIDIDDDDIVTSKPKSGDRDEAKKWLNDLLADGSMTKNEVESAGENRSFSMITIRRAARELKVHMTTTGFGNKKISVWSLSKNEKNDERKNEKNDDEIA